MIKSLSRKVGFDATNGKKSNEFIAGISGLFSTAYVVPLIINIYKKFGLEQSSLFIGLVAALAITNIVAAFIVKKPIILGTSFTVAMIVTDSLITHGGYTWQETLSVLLLSSFILVLLNYKDIGINLVMKIPRFIKTSITFATGVYLFWSGLKTIGFSDISNSGISIGSFGNPMLWIALAGISLLILFYYRKSKFGVLYVMGALTVVAVIAKFTWDKNLTGFGDFKDFSNFSSSNSAFSGLGSFYHGFENPTTYLFALIIVILTIAGIPGTTYPIGNSLKFNKEENLKYEENTFKSTSLVSPLYGLMPVGYPAIYGETLVMTSSGAKTGLSTLSLGFLYILLIALYPIIPVMSNNVVIAPPMMFVGFLMMKSIDLTAFKNPISVVTGIVIIIVAISTNSIPHGMAFGFSVYVLISLPQKATREKLDIYIIIITLLLISYEIITYVYA